MKKKILIIAVIIIFLAVLFLPELGRPLCSKPHIGGSFSGQRDFGAIVSTDRMAEFLRKDGWNVKIYTPDTSYNLPSDKWPLMAKKRTLIIGPKLKVRYNYFANEPQALYLRIEPLTGVWFINRLVFNDVISRMNSEFPEFNLNKNFDHFGYNRTCS